MIDIAVDNAGLRVGGCLFGLGMRGYGYLLPFQPGAALGRRLGGYRLRGLFVPNPAQEAPAEEAGSQGQDCRAQVGD
jgi:hypothetical protein